MNRNPTANAQHRPIPIENRKRAVRTNKNEPAEFRDIARSCPACRAGCHLVLRTNFWNRGDDGRGLVIFGGVGFGL